MARTIAKDHDQKRLHILDVAAEVFAREGIARASMNEVARSCGISKANIYHYYQSKDALLFDILDNYLTQLRDQVKAVDLSAMAPPEQLSALVTEFLVAYEGMDHEHKILTEGIPLLPVPQQKILKDIQRDLVRQLSDILIQISRDFENDKTKLRDVTMSIFGMLNWFYMWQPNANKKAREAYAQTITDLCLNGMGGLKSG